VRGVGKIATPECRTDESASTDRFSITRVAIKQALAWGSSPGSKGPGVFPREKLRVPRGQTETREPAVCPKQAGLENCRTTHLLSESTAVCRIPAAGIADCCCQTAMLGNVARAGEAATFGCVDIAKLTAGLDARRETTEITHRGVGRPSAVAKSHTPASSNTHPANKWVGSLAFHD
jgi:hypothetical protein